VTLYNAAVLRGCIGHPEFADQFTVPPMEILTPQPPEREPIVPEGEVEWEDDYYTTYARVLLPNIEVHAAEATARSLVEGLKSVNHPTKGTWRRRVHSCAFTRIYHFITCQSALLEPPWA
jgi:hypothetical protein